MLHASEVIAFAPSADLRQARAFYEQVLGLRAIEQNDFACVFDSTCPSVPPYTSSVGVAEATAGSATSARSTAISANADHNDRVPLFMGHRLLGVLGRVKREGQNPSVKRHRIDAPVPANQLGCGDDERIDQESLRLSTDLWLALAHDFLG